MQQDLITQAWTAFEEAVRFDEKRTRLAGVGKESLAATATRAVEKHLDRAVALEAAAFGDESVAA